MSNALFQLRHLVKPPAIIERRGKVRWAAWSDELIASLSEEPRLEMLVSAFVWHLLTSEPRWWTRIELRDAVEHAIHAGKVTGSGSNPRGTVGQFLSIPQKSAPPKVIERDGKVLWASWEN